MKRFRVFYGVTILFVVVLATVACGTSATPALTQTATPVSPITTPAAELAWQKEWDNLVTEAKKEGKVVICSSLASEARDTLSQAFTAKYKVDLEWVLGKPAQLVPKVLAERRAGLYLADLFMAGGGTVVPGLGPTGALVPLDSVLLLPEVLDRKNWWGGDLLWQDVDHLQIRFLAYPIQPFTINTDIVGADEIKSYRDLLNPKWKGKIVSLDPTIAGPTLNFFTMAEYGAIDVAYLRELGKQVDLVTRDERLLVEWVARGKYAIGIGVSKDLQSEFAAVGAPIKPITPIEGTCLNAGGGGLALLDKAPHSKTAELLINWLLSKEGQIVASKAWGAQSARLDVPTDNLDPDGLRQPGVKYVLAMGPKYEPLQDGYMRMAKDVWGHLLK